MPTGKYLTFIKKALLELKKEKLLRNIIIPEPYYDEPKINSYTAQPYSKKKLPASGLSSEKPEIALLRCIGEFIERNALTDSTHYNIERKSFLKFKTSALNPDIYNRTTDTYRETPLSWVKSFKGIDKKSPCFIPAQLVFLSNKYQKNEPLLSPVISTGAAGGFDHESTLLRAIYEVVERDSFMSIYLTKSIPKRINLSSIPYKKVRNLIAYYHRYLFDIQIFDITTNLGIPVFLVIATDNSGLGPRITISTKAGSNIGETLLGALEGCLLTRTWIRTNMMHYYRKYSTVPKSIDNIAKRAQYWLPRRRSKELNFLLGAPYARNYSFCSSYKDKLVELEEIYNKIKRENYELYYVDISKNINKNLRYKVYKAIIPGLQPLYLDESKKTVIEKRLKEVSYFFNKKKFTINQVPHPFL